MNPLSQTPSEKDSNSRTWMPSVALAAIGIYLAVLMLPGGTPGFTEGIDDSWQFVVSRAFAEGWAFGTDIIFPYGPLGFVITQHYYPDTYLYAVLIRVGVALVTVANAGRLFERLGLELPVRALLLFALATIAGFSFFHEALFFGLGILLVARYFLEDRPRPDVLLIALAFALGVTSLIKFTYFVTGAMVVGAVSLDLAIRHRRVPFAAPVFAAGFLAAWLTAGQSLGNLLTYFANYIRLASSYNDAKAFHVGDPLVGVTDANAWFLFAIVLGVVVYRTTAAAGGRLKAMLHTGAVAGLLFVIFKTSFVRNDDHALIAADAGFVFGLCYLPVALRHAASRRMAWVYAVILIGMPLWSGVLFGIVQSWRADSLYRNPIESVATATQQSATALAALVDPAGRARAYEANLARLRDENPIPIPHSSVDFFCLHQSLAFAYGLDYRPRPVFQSYSAHSPVFLEMNAEFLRGPRAPNEILYHFETIDGRVPTHDDSLAFLEILRSYRLAESAGEWARFERSGAERAVSLVPLGERTARFGETVPIPANEGLVWVAMDIESTIPGRVLSLLYKPPTLSMSVRIDGVETEPSSRLVTAMARSGFLVSPLVSKTKNICAIATSPTAAAALPRVRALRIDGTIGASIAYNPEFRVRFYRLTIETAVASSPIIGGGDH